MWVLYRGSPALSIAILGFAQPAALQPRVQRRMRVHLAAEHAAALVNRGQVALLKQRGQAALRLIPDGKAQRIAGDFFRPRRALKGVLEEELLRDVGIAQAAQQPPFCGASAAWRAASRGSESQTSPLCGTLRRRRMCSMS